jgi:putative transposase
VAPLPAARSCAADTAYDSDALRRFLIGRGTRPVIPNNPTRKRLHPFDADACKQRNMVERMVCRLRDWRRIATRYDELATNFAADIAIATIVLWRT